MSPVCGRLSMTSLLRNDGGATLPRPRCLPLLPLTAYPRHSAQRQHDYQNTGPRTLQSPPPPVALYPCKTHRRPLFSRKIISPSPGASSSYIHNPPPSASMRTSAAKLVRDAWKCVPNVPEARPVCVLPGARDLSQCH